MLDLAATLSTARPVEWRLAEAMALPFADASFDLVACQFGAMFFPDRPHAYGEIRRVLKPGGFFLFNVWDHLDSNELAATVTAALDEAFPDEPPRFMARTPHGYHDLQQLRADLAQGGFEREADIVTLTLRRGGDRHVDPGPRRHRRTLESTTHEKGCRTRRRRARHHRQHAL